MVDPEPVAPEYVIEPYCPANVRPVAPDAGRMGVVPTVKVRTQVTPLLLITPEAYTGGAAAAFIAIQAT
jgi:hypothetical protein